ncbi:MAG: hypothetical protein ACI8TL_001763 [Natronomonas sp.]|jgi:hypothetical protein
MTHYLPVVETLGGLEVETGDPGVDHDIDTAADPERLRRE